MTVIKISKNPDYKQIEQELGIKIDCIRYTHNDIYLQTADELTDKQVNNMKTALKPHFPNKKIEKHQKKIKPKGLGKPNVDKTKTQKTLPIKEKIRNAKAALKHYERALSYEVNNPGQTPKDQQKAEQSIRRITRLKDETSRELEVLVAEKNRLSKEHLKHPNP